MQNHRKVTNRQPTPYRCEHFPIIAPKERVAAKMYRSQLCSTCGDDETGPQSLRACFAASRIFMFISCRSSKKTMERYTCCHFTSDVDVFFVAQVEATVGYFKVKKWVPKDQDHLTKELHGGLTDKGDASGLAKVKRGGKSMTFLAMSRSVHRRCTISLARGGAEHLPPISPRYTRSCPHSRRCHHVF